MHEYQQQQCFSSLKGKKCLKPPSTRCSSYARFIIEQMAAFHLSLITRIVVNWMRYFILYMCTLSWVECNMCSNMRKRERVKKKQKRRKKVDFVLFSQLILLFSSYLHICICVHEWALMIMIKWGRILCFPSTVKPYSITMRNETSFQQALSLWHSLEGSEQPEKVI